MRRNDESRVTFVTFTVLALLPIGIGLLLGAGRGYLGLLILNVSALFSVGAVLIAHKGPSARRKRARGGKPMFRKPPSPREEWYSSDEKNEERNGKCE